MFLESSKSLRQILRDGFSPQLLESYKAGVSVRRQLLELPNEGEEVPDPSPLVGGGWIVELKGYHYFNGRIGEEGEAHVLKYLIEFLEKGSVELPDDEGNKTGEDVDD